jgi:hypothetical protein
MAPKRRRQFPGIPEKKRIHFTPLYLRKIPSSSIPGEAPHISTEDAPPILPDTVSEQAEDRTGLYEIEHLDPIENYDKFPGVAAPYSIRIPPLLLNGMNPFFLEPKGKDVDMEDECPKTPPPKQAKKKKSSLKLEGEDANVRLTKRVMFAEFDEGEEEEDDDMPDPKLEEFQAARRKEISFSHDADVVHDERSQVSRDSILLAAKVFEKRMDQIRRESTQLRQCHAEFRFVPEDRFGSFPPRRPLWLLFKHDVKKRLEYQDLNHMEFVENWTEDAFPETVTAPSEYFERQAFTMGDVKVAINIPLYMFDNPQVDLKYPAIDLKEVSLQNPWHPRIHVMSFRHQFHSNLFLDGI